MRLADTWVQFELAAKRLIDLACIAASLMQNMHVIAAIALQSSQFFAGTRGV